MNKQHSIKRDLMAEKLFWPIFESTRLKKYSARNGKDKAMDVALEDAYGIVDEMLILLKEEKK